MSRQRRLLVSILIVVGIIAGVAYYLRSTGSEESVAKDAQTATGIADKYSDRQPDFLFSELRGGPIQEADTKYRLRAVTNSLVSGNCHFILNKNEETFILSTSITNSSICQLTRPLSSFSEYGVWNVRLIFEDSSGKYGYGQDTTVVVTDKIEFKKVEISTLSARRVGGAIKVQANLSEDIPGLCNFGFTHGTRIVSANAKNTAGAMCEADIPISKFPYTHMWKMSVVFIGDDELAPANGSAERTVYINVD